MHKISREYSFYTKYSEQIKNNKFNNFILLPIKDIIKCNNNNNKKIIWYIYAFEELNYDYNYEVVSKLNFKKWLNYTIEICLIIYYLNNFLGIYHNDLCLNNNLRNIMIKK